MTNVAVFGASGFVGRSLSVALASKKYKVVPVTRENYSQHIGKKYDVVINAAHPAARFWANKNPDLDFKETVQKTADIFYKCSFKKFVQISSVSARCQLDTVYGRHKLAAESICNSGDNSIIRLSSMFGKDLKKGVLINMLKGEKVFISGDSRYAFASMDFVVDHIASHLDSKGVVEVGAFNSVSMIDIAKHLNAKIEFEGDVDVQEIENPGSNFPDAKEVFLYLDKMKQSISKL